MHPQKISKILLLSSIIYFLMLLCFFMLVQASPHFQHSVGPLKQFEGQCFPNFIGTKMAPMANLLWIIVIKTHLFELWLERTQRIFQNSSFSEWSFDLASLKAFSWFSYRSSLVLLQFKIFFEPGKFSYYFFTAIHCLVLFGLSSLFWGFDFLLFCLVFHLYSEVLNSFVLLLDLLSISLFLFSQDKITYPFPKKNNNLQRSWFFFY